jgi:hypothetical protein
MQHRTTIYAAEAPIVQFMGDIKWQIIRAASRAGVKGPQLQILIELAAIMDHRRIAYPASEADIQELTGLGRACVYKHVSLLEKSGWLRRAGFKARQLCDPSTAVDNHADDGEAPNNDRKSAPQAHLEAPDPSTAARNFSMGARLFSTAVDAPVSTGARIFSTAMEKARAPVDELRAAVDSRLIERARAAVAADALPAVSAAAAGEGLEEELPAAADKLSLPESEAMIRLLLDAHSKVNPDPERFSYTTAVELASDPKATLDLIRGVIERADHYEQTKAPLGNYLGYVRQGIIDRYRPLGRRDLRRMSEPQQEEFHAARQSELEKDLADRRARVELMALPPDHLQRLLNRAIDANRGPREAMADALRSAGIAGIRTQHLVRGELYKQLLLERQRQAPPPPATDTPQRSQSAC